MERFPNRRDAGRQLAQKLLKYTGHPDVIVLALPRGGVPVAYEVALALKTPLDVLVVRKLGLPGQQELAIGAIASGGIRILNQDILDAFSIGQEVVDQVTGQERTELQRREKQYRGDRPPLEVQNRIVILIDDGLATGASMLAAIHGLRTKHPVQIVAAVPVAPPEAIDLLRNHVDEIYCVTSPSWFEGVGKWYEDFSQTTDEEVQTLLQKARIQPL